MQKPPEPGFRCGGRQGQFGRQVRFCRGQGFSRGQERVIGGYHSQGIGQSCGKGRGQGKGHSEGQEHSQIAGQIQTLTRIRGGCHGQNRGRMLQPSLSPCSRPQASFQHDTFLSANPISHDEVAIDDDTDARSQANEHSGSQKAASKIESWNDVDDSDEIGFGNANPYQQMTAIHSRFSSRSRGRGFGKYVAVRCQPYSAAQEAINPDVETLLRTKVKLGNSRNTLSNRAYQSRIGQSVILAEKRMVTAGSWQQKDSNQNGVLGDRVKSAGDEMQQKTKNVAAVEGDLANSSSQPAFKVEQSQVIEYLVNHHKESCTLFDIQYNSGIFPCILQPEEILRSLGSCHLVRVLIDPADLDNSLVKVYMKKLRLCVEHKPPRGCSRTSCQYIHLCRDFMIGCCFSQICTLGHDVELEHNKKIMIECGIEIFSADEKLSLIRWSNLLVCSEHNRSEGCPVPNTCFKLHVCNSYILTKCLIPSDKCPQGHDLFNEQNMKILRLYEVDQLKVNFLLRLVVGIHDDQFHKGNSLLLRNGHKDCAGETKPARDDSCYSGRDPATEQIVVDTTARSEWSAESCTSGKQDFNFNSQQEPNIPKFCGIVELKSKPVSSGCENTEREELGLTEQLMNRCMSFEKHTCDKMENCIRRHGSKFPYLWRVQVNAEWFNLENNELIEEEFSNPDAEKFWGTACLLDITLCIDFSSFMSEVGVIQRLSTPSYAVCRDKIDATRWLWYWHDSSGKWVLYGQNNESPYQDVLEAKFLKDSRHVCCFKINGCNYELDFLKMEQRNLETNFCRPIRRRPFYRNGDSVEITCNEYHYDESKVPFRWAPMDTESKHGMELVPLHLDDTNYVDIKSSFFATLRAGNFKIQRIYRLQNLDLWHCFQMKKVIMEKKIGGRVEEVYVYHGTPEEETIRWICSLGFDQRMHGRHGTFYGRGVYFATSANYSHTYTQPSDRGLRYMFYARVIVGRTVTGRSEYRRPPPIDPTKPTEGLYDTCVNSTANPSIYVIFDNNQAYPEYLIEYRDLSEADLDPLHPASAASATTVNAYRSSRSRCNGAATSGTPPSALVWTSPVDTPDFSSVFDTALPNKSCQPQSSLTYMLPPPRNYRAHVSRSGRRSSARLFPYISAIAPPTTYSLQADVSVLATTSVSLNHSPPAPTLAPAPAPTLAPAPTPAPTSTPTPAPASAPAASFQSDFHEHPSDDFPSVEKQATCNIM